MLLVTGATGAVGRALVPLLLARGQQVRVLSRSPDKARTLFGNAVEAAAGDVMDAAGLRAALAGAERVFLLTPPQQNGPDVDRAVHDLAAQAAVRKIVRLSALQAIGAAGQELAAVTARGDGGPAWTILRPGGFMSNTLGWADTIRRERLVRAYFADQQVAWIDPADIAAVAAHALTEEGHAGKEYLLSGPEALSPREQAAILAAALGVAITVIDRSPAEMRAEFLAQGMPPTRADAILAARATGASPLGRTSFPTVEQITGRPPRTFAEWVAAHLDAFR